MLAEVHRADRYPMHWPADPAGWLDPSGLMQAWVAELDGGIVGHVGLVFDATRSVVPGVPAERTAAVSRLFVAARARGTGLARALLAAATSRAEREDLDVVLDVVDDQSGAIAFYERLGWRLLARRPATWTTALGDRPLVRVYAGPPQPTEPNR